MNYEIRNSMGKKVVTVHSVIGPLVIETPAPDSAKISFTATTDMQRSMGKVVSSVEGMCCVDTVWDGQRVMIDNIRGFQGVGIADAVVVMEHLRLDGTMELICCKAAPDTGDINFLNLSWDKSKVRIDLVTGEAQNVSI